MVRREGERERAGQSGGEVTKKEPKLKEQRRDRDVSDGCRFSLKFAGEGEVRGTGSRREMHVKAGVVVL